MRKYCTEAATLKFVQKVDSQVSLDTKNLLLDPSRQVPFRCGQLQ